MLAPDRLCHIFFCQSSRTVPYSISGGCKICLSFDPEGLGQLSNYRVGHCSCINTCHSSKSQHGARIYLHLSCSSHRRFGRLSAFGLHTRLTCPSTRSRRQASCWTVDSGSHLHETLCPPKPQKPQNFSFSWGTEAPRASANECVGVCVCVCVFMTGPGSERHSKARAVDAQGHLEGESLPASSSCPK